MSWLDKCLQCGKIRDRHRPRSVHGRIEDQGHGISEATLEAIWRCAEYCVHDHEFVRRIAIADRAAEDDEPEPYRSAECPTCQRGRGDNLYCSNPFHLNGRDACNHEPSAPTAYDLALRANARLNDYDLEWPDVLARLQAIETNQADIVARLLTLEEKGK